MALAASVFALQTRDGAKPPADGDAEPAEAAEPGLARRFTLRPAEG